MMKRDCVWSGVGLTDKLIFFLTMFISGTPFVNIYSGLQFLCVLYFPICISTLANELRRTTAIYCAMFIMVLFAMGVNLGDGYRYYLLFGIRMSAAYLAARQIPLRQLSRMFFDTIALICPISLVGYAIVNLTTLDDFFPRLAGPMGDKFSTVGLFSVFLEYPERNAGFFWEPGIFASMIILALCCAVFRLKEITDRIERRKIIKSSVIMVVTIITTISSAGYVLLGLFILFAVASKKGKRNSNLTVLGWSSFAVLLACLLSMERILEVFSMQNNYYLKRMTVRGILESSRMKYFAEGFMLFWKNPITGVGISELNKFTQMMGMDTSTSINMLLGFGLLGVLYTLLIIRGVWCRNVPLTAKLILCVIMLAIVNKEPHTGIMITWVFIFAANLSPKSRKHP